MNRHRSIASVLAVVSLVVGSTTAEEYAPNSGWQPFSWRTSCSGCFINEEPFTFSISSGPSGCSAVLHVTDSERPGETFLVYNNGVYTGLTTSPPGIVCDFFNRYTEDFDHAFSSSHWSSGSLALTPGSYSIQIQMGQYCNNNINGVGAFRVVYEDCNCNGVPDNQDLADGTSPDCNGNGLPDECDIAFLTSQDCNGNLVLDECEIASGTAEDVNANSIPDDCECLADIDNDTFVTVTDLLLLLATWGLCPPVGDCFGDIDFDGTVAVPDLLRLLAAWGACP